MRGPEEQEIDQAHAEKAAAQAADAAAVEAALIAEQEEAEALADQP